MFLHEQIIIKVLQIYFPQGCGYNQLSDRENEHLKSEGTGCYKRYNLTKIYITIYYNIFLKIVKFLNHNASDV